MSISV